MDELISEFQSESKTLIGQLIELLESIESDYSQYKRLEEYGNIVDRIMGAAKTMAEAMPGLKNSLDSIGQYSELCKTVSYKGSQVSNNESLYNVVVALLLDATEMLQDMVTNIGDHALVDVKKVLSKTFLDRLRWISQQFDENLRSSVDIKQKTNQASIEDLLKSLGI